MQSQCLKSGGPFPAPPKPFRMTPVSAWQQIYHTGPSSMMGLVGMGCRGQGCRSQDTRCVPGGHQHREEPGVNICSLPPGSPGSMLERAAPRIIQAPAQSPFMHPPPQSGRLRSALNCHRELHSPAGWRRSRGGESCLPPRLAGLGAILPSTARLSSVPTQLPSKWARAQPGWAGYRWRGRG